MQKHIDKNQAFLENKNTVVWNLGKMLSVVFKKNTNHNFTHK